MATKKELEARIIALEAQVADLHARIFQLGGWVPTPYVPQPYPHTWPQITCDTATH